MVYRGRRCERGEELLSTMAIKAYSCYFSLWCGFCSSTSSRPKRMALFPASNRTTYVSRETAPGAQASNGVGACTVSE